MKIVLINPEFKNESYNLNFRKADNILIPYGLCHIASFLEDKGIEVKIIDGQEECFSYNDFIRIINEYKPDVVGISVMTSRKMEVIQLANKIRENTNTKIICVGGPHITASPNFLSEGSFDYGIRGDGEVPFHKLISLIQNNNLSYRDFLLIPGLVFKQGMKIISNEIYVEKNLDSLPLPKFDFTNDLSKYHPSIVSSKRLPSIALITSRGCPYSCAYCSNSIEKVLWRANSPEYILLEITSLAKYGIKDIAFYDDIFTYDRERIMNFCKLLINNKIDLTWSCLTRADRVDEELLKLMKKAGCWLISYGIESGNQRILNEMHKAITKETIVNAIKLTKKIGMQVKAYFMMGNPGESIETLDDTINFSLELPLDYVTYYFVNVLPATKLEKNYKNHGKLVKAPKSILPFGKEIFIPHNLTVDILVKKQKEAIKKFYLRPKYLLRRLLTINSIYEIQRNIYGLISIFKKN